jgi:hypothetical protein
LGLVGGKLVSPLSDDRHVHASGDTIEVVRYERAGKWYVESRPNARPQRPRWALSLREAAKIAQDIERAGGEIRYGLPGGKMFDRIARGDV